MSVQTLQSQQINAFNCPCTISGAITGNTSINFTRFNNIIYLSFPGLTDVVGVAGPTITYTPTVSIPAEYAPKAGVFRTISVASGSVQALGTIIFPNNFSSFSIALQSGGNFASVAGVVDNTIIWAAPGSF